MTNGFAPLETPFDSSIRVPGSKSITIRALVTGSLAGGRSHIYGALDAEDTLAMVRALRQLGVDLSVGGDPWVIDGTGGHLRAPETAIDAGGSGLTARIGLMLAALVDGTTTVDGSGRMRERPVGPVIEVLRSQGVEVQGDSLPATVRGRGGLWGGEIVVGPTPTSQAVTAVLLVSPMADNPTTIRTNGLTGSLGYLDLTCQVMEAFGSSPRRVITGFEVDPTGYRAADFTVAPDASSAVYPMVAAAITGSKVEIEGLNLDDPQPDMVVAQHLQTMGCRLAEGSRGLVVEGPDLLASIEVNMADAPDGALALAIACLFAEGTSRISGLESLAHKESDRLTAMNQAISAVGGEIRVEGEALILDGVDPRGATVDPHGDHRIAMAMALAGLRITGVEVRSPSVVDKTWPGYWEDMAIMMEAGSQGLP